MFIDVGFYVYVVILLVLSICSVPFKMQKSNERIALSLLFWSTFLAEVLGDLVYRGNQNNMMVYHFFNPIQLFLICLYYNSIIPEFRKRNIGIYIGIAGILFALINSLFIQKIDGFHSNYLLFESIVIIAMSLHSFYSIIKRDDIDILKHEPFWISLVLLLFWSITYAYWGLGYAFDKSEKQVFKVMVTILTVINLLTYLSFTVIIILGKKNKLLNEN